MAFENQEQFNNLDHYRKYLTCKAGFYTAYETDKGTFIEADSISFASMDELEFSDLYSKMIDVIIQEIGVTSEIIEKEIVEFM